MSECTISDGAATHCTFKACCRELALESRSFPQFACWLLTGSGVVGGASCHDAAAATARVVARQQSHCAMSAVASRVGDK